MQTVYRMVQTAKYNGANAAEFLAMFNALNVYGYQWAIKSSTAGYVTLRPSPDDGSEFWVYTNTWVIATPEQGILELIGQAEYDMKYKSQDVALAKPNYGGFGVAGVPALAIGATSSPIQVTIKPTQKDTGYVAESYLPVAGNVLGSYQIVSTTIVSTSRVDVVVKNIGILALSAASVLVHVSAP